MQAWPLWRLKQTHMYASCNLTLQHVDKLELHHTIICRERVCTGSCQHCCCSAAHSFSLVRSSLRRDCVAAAAFSASAISFRFASTCGAHQP